MNLVMLWTDNSAGVLGFKIYQSDDQGLTWNHIDNVLPGVTSYTLNNIVPGKDYYLGVTGTDGNTYESQMVSGHLKCYGPLMSIFVGDSGDENQQLINIPVGASGSYYILLGKNKVSKQLVFKFSTENVQISNQRTVTIGIVKKGGKSSKFTETLNSIYLGNSDVNVQTGFQLLAGKSEVFKIKEGNQLFAVTDSPLPLELRVFRLSKDPNKEI